MIVPVLLLFLFQLPGNGREATGELTVTARVASSVSVTFAANGTPVIVVANAKADADALTRVSSQSPSNKTAHPNEESTHVKQHNPKRF
ncbi:MAG TPA: hypothetical protein VN669_00800 [Candidatus Acidoferrales bacterium]|jgi:hypothetical protein|nr:hypothetical protein [Candidatus Acidoferrales bacterium]